MKDDNVLFYNFDIYDTNILYEKIDEEKLLRILDEISNTDNYKALFNIVSENQKKFWKSNIKPIVSECLEDINTIPFDLYVYVNKYISNKIFNCDNYLITKMRLWIFILIMVVTLIISRWDRNGQSLNLSRKINLKYTNILLQ